MGAHRDVSDAARGAVARLACGFYLAALICAFTVSSMLLAHFGVAYDTDGGGALQKIHPATDLALLAIALTCARRGLPDRLAGLPGLLMFAAMWTLLLVFSIVVQHAPVAVLLDNYALAAATLLIADDLGAPTRRMIRRFLHGVMFANAMIGAAEFATHWRLVPYVIGGVEELADTRSTALLGHPLTNAGTTGVYLLCLLLGGDPLLTPGRRLALIAAQLVGLVVFGGRTAIVFVCLILLAKAVIAGGRILLGGAFDLKASIAIFAGAPLALLLGGLIYALGGLDRLIERFTDDNGSALARVIMFRLFDLFPLSDLLLGPDPSEVTSTLATLGIPVGIENTWIAFIFQYGALMTLCFALGLAALLFEIYRRARPGALPLFVYFIGVISSATGLSSKTAQLAHFVVLLTFLFRDFPSRRHGEASAATVAAPPAALPISAS